MHTPSMNYYIFGLGDITMERVEAENQECGMNFQLDSVLPPSIRKENPFYKMYLHLFS